MWAAARWAHTYLLPDDPVSQAMHDRYGATPAGSAAADQLVQIAGPPLMDCLTHPWISFPCRLAQCHCRHN